MKLRLKVIDGPHLGKEFVFDSHDTFLVGRVEDAHLRLSYDDPYFSRRHFLIEVNPPRCRLLDLRSRNGTMVNQVRVDSAELRNEDIVSAGHTVFKVFVEYSDSVEETLSAPMVVHQPKQPEVTLPLPDRISLQVPGYEIQEEIGRGGMGIVYKAAHKRTRKLYAIKTIVPAVGVSQRQLECFVRECSILAELSHPNIVGFHEIGEADGILFLVMEYISGVDLASILERRGRLDVKSATRILCQALAGLGHAHSRGFVHRDIKPSNILISTTPGQRVAKLADFGLARVYEASKLSGLTLQGETGGTPAYMAPEQVTHYREVRPAADQYSAAATLYKMLSSKTPHDLPIEPARQLIHLLTEKPIPILERRSDLPKALTQAIDRALSREPRDRFPNVISFRSELLKFT